MKALYLRELDESHYQKSVPSQTKEKITAIEHDLTNSPIVLGRVGVIIDSKYSDSYGQHSPSVLRRYALEAADATSALIKNQKDLETAKWAKNGYLPHLTDQEVKEKLDEHAKNGFTVILRPPSGNNTEVKHYTFAVTRPSSLSEDGQVRIEYAPLLIAHQPNKKLQRNIFTRPMAAIDYRAIPGHTIGYNWTVGNDQQWHIHEPAIAKYFDPSTKYTQRDWPDAHSAAYRSIQFKPAGVPLKDYIAISNQFNNTLDVHFRDFYHPSSNRNMRILDFQQKKRELMHVFLQEPAIASHKLD